MAAGKTGKTAEFYIAYMTMGNKVLFIAQTAYGIEIIVESKSPLVQ